MKTKCSDSRRRKQGGRRLFGEDGPAAPSPDPRPPPPPPPCPPPSSPAPFSIAPLRHPSRRGPLCLLRSKVRPSAGGPPCPRCFGRVQDTRTNEHLLSPLRSPHALLPSNMVGNTWNAQYASHTRTPSTFLVVVRTLFALPHDSGTNSACTRDSGLQGHRERPHHVPAFESCAWLVSLGVRAAALRRTCAVDRGSVRDKRVGLSCSRWLARD